MEVNLFGNVGKITGRKKGNYTIYTVCEAGSGRWSTVLIDHSKISVSLKQGQEILVRGRPSTGVFKNRDGEVVSEMRVIASEIITEKEMTAKIRAVSYGQVTKRYRPGVKDGEKFIVIEVNDIKVFAKGGVADLIDKYGRVGKSMVISGEVAMFDGQTSSAIVADWVQLGKG